MCTRFRIGFAPAEARSRMLFGRTTRKWATTPIRTLSFHGRAEGAKDRERSLGLAQFDQPAEARAGDGANRGIGIPMAADAARAK
jgi:hypothetical protein